MILRGLIVANNKKIYCNAIENGNIPKCVDIFDRGENHFQVINEVTLTGIEDWFFDEKNRSFCFHAFNKYFDDIDGGAMDTMMCTHFVWVSGGCPLKHGEFAGGRTDEIRFNYNNGEEGLESFVEWIRSQNEVGTPVKVYYIMKEPIYHGKMSHYRTTWITMNELMESKRRMESKEK